MRAALACIGLALVASIAGCGGSSGPGSFVGTWSCNSALGAFMLVVTENAGGSLTAMGSGGGLQCSLNYTVQGSTATVQSGQTCMGLAVTGGSTTVNGSSLSGAITGQTLTGQTLTEMYTCSK
jgi:hypothetical protein